MSKKAMMEVRGALLTTSNTIGGDARTGVGGNEINKMIDSAIVDAVNRAADFRPMVSRKPMDQLSHIWNVRFNLGSSSKTAFYAEGASGTAFPSNKTQLVAPAKAIRSDYEVTGLHLSGSASYYNAIQDEALDAATSHVIAEDKVYICGPDTSAYGLTGAYDGLLQLMGSNAAFGDTDVVYGVARAVARDELDVQVVLGGAVAPAALSLEDLNSAITKSDKQGAKAHKRIFFCSEERRNEIDELLQAQQRFVAPSLEIEGGFRVSSYRNIPIIADRFMDKNGITWDGAIKTKSYADNSMYLLDMDYIEFRVLNGVDMTNVTIDGADASQRSDVVGGYFKTYGVFIMKRFDTQVLFANLTTP